MQAGGAGNFAHSVRKMNKPDSSGKGKTAVQTGTVIDFRKPLLLAPDIPESPVR